MNMNAPLRMPTSNGGSVDVVGGDLLAEVADALLQLVLVDDDAADVRVVHARCARSRGSGGLGSDPEEATGARRHLHAVVDTVTDDPARPVRRRRDDARATPRGAIGGRDARLPQRVGDALGPAAAERPEARRPAPGTRRRPSSPTRSASSTAVVRPSGQATGGACSIQASSANRAEPRAPGQRRAARRAGAGAAVAGRGAARPPARSTRGRPGARPRAVSRARPRARASTCSSAGGGGAEPLAHGAAASGAARREQRGDVERSARSSSAAASASRYSSSSRSSSACRASTSTRSRRASRSSRGITSRRSQTRRKCTSSFIGSCTGARPSRAQISRVSARRRPSSGRRS